MYEYLVGVTPPGSRTELRYWGTLYIPSSSEEIAAKMALQIIRREHGYNVTHEYTCVVNRLEGADEEY